MQGIAVEELIIAELVKFPYFCGMWKVFTVFIRAHSVQGFVYHFITCPSPPPHCEELFRVVTLKIACLLGCCSVALVMEAVSFSELLVIFYETAWWNITEDSHFILVTMRT
jgi:hypothetical protein